MFSLYSKGSLNISLNVIENNKVKLDLDFYSEKTHIYTNTFGDIMDHPFGDLPLINFSKIYNLVQ